MILELVGSRILAPYFGTSINVWTVIIGVFLISLSIGYWYGGKFADKKPQITTLFYVILLPSFYIGLLILFKDPVLKTISSLSYHYLIQVLLSTLILFTIPNILLAMVSPYVGRLISYKLDRSGSVIGSISAVSTIGSIIGTFLAGFYLLPKYTTIQILIFLSVFLLINAIFLFFFIKNKKTPFISTVIFFLFLVFLVNSYSKKYEGVPSQYYNINILEMTVKGRPTLGLVTDLRAPQSVIYLDNSRELYFPYINFFKLIFYFNPNIKKTLALGGGAYTYPRYYLDQDKKATIDVVEIDPKITEIAKKYFYLKDDARMNIFHQDVRYFLNKSNTKYDAIISDVYGSFYIPFQITTREAVEKMFNLLNDKGVIIVNIVSPMSEEKSKFLRAEYKTFKQIFPQVYLFPMSYKDLDLKENIMLVALKSKEKPNFKIEDKNLQVFLDNLWKRDLNLSDVPVLTDNYAPVEFYKL